MFNSNHKDAVRKTQNDRRFCVLFSAQQQAADLAGRHGRRLLPKHDWLQGDGYAIVSGTAAYLCRSPTNSTPPQVASVPRDYRHGRCNRRQRRGR